MADWSVIWLEISSHPSTSSFNIHLSQNYSFSCISTTFFQVAWRKSQKYFQGCENNCLFWRGCVIFSSAMKALIVFSLGRQEASRMKTLRMLLDESPKTSYHTTSQGRHSAPVTLSCKHPLQKQNCRFSHSLGHPVQCAIICTLEVASTHEIATWNKTLFFHCWRTSLSPLAVD